MKTKYLKLLLFFIFAAILTGFKTSPLNSPQAVSAQDEIIVAVIDTGVDLSHPDIRGNLWINAGESGVDAQGRDKSTNGIDDDANGLPDDFHGWNFSHRNNNVNDENGHGTHVSGIIVGLDANREKRIRIMVLKYYDSKASGMANLLSSVQAIRYAVKMGARIINYSGGGSFAVAEEKAAIAEAEKAGILFVAAAGNERSNTDIFRYYPANYPLSNILSVAAHDQKGQLVPTSNYGARSIDTAALGKNVFSALPHGRRGWMTGTSQATASATALSARLLLSRDDLNSPKELIELISLSGLYNESMIGKTKFNTMISFERALQMRGFPITQASHIKSTLYTSTVGE